jgi:hypothetical protein
VRRHDSGWRDGRLAITHAAYGLNLPLAGMDLPMVEYDRGEALAVINYVRRDLPLPRGEDVGRAFEAVASLRRDDGPQLPFLTAQYDPRNWAFRLFGHNGAARDLLGTSGWLAVTEHHFARLLYRLRGRVMPDLEPFGVTFSTAPWLQYDGQQAVTGWPGQDMSVRRRAYEPEPTDQLRVPFSLRNPCADIDLAVVGRSGAVALLVDYKLASAHVDPSHKTHQAMSGIRDNDGRTVPSLIVKYDPSGDQWKFHALALNRAGELLLIDVLTSTYAIAPTSELNDWAYLDERRWLAVLDAARAS